MIDRPLILYVPGLLPKPEAEVHRDALRRCLLAGVRRQDARLAAELAADEHCFDVVSWTYDFYGEHRDFSIDAAAVDAVIAQPLATDEDIREASSLRLRSVRWLFGMADLLPVLIPHVASERMQLHLRDLRRYLGNRNEIADHVRQMLKLALRAAAEAERPVLLIAHSMGSVIAYEALWEMSRDAADSVRIDLLLTMGSPLGQRYMQRRIAGHAETGSRRYPDNICRWMNLTAVGDLTAIDPDLADDFAAMTQLELVDSIEDFGIHNYFRLRGKLNVHAEYGYLVNAVTAGIVTDWWRSVWSK
jgi:hypothetical protein